MSFLVPAFLAGLAALLIPVLIHLTRRQTKEAVEFPSLMFVQRVPHRSTRRKQIRNWPLLLLRCLAIALIALAFARPLVQREEDGVIAEGVGAREVVILLDRSYSMGYGQRWDAAKRAAEERIASLRPRDRATLLLFDSRGEALVQSSTDRALLRSSLAGARIGSRATRYAPGLRHAERVLAASTLPRREVILISDFQRNGWDLDAGEMSSIRFPQGTVVTPVSIAGGAEPNVTIASVAFRRSLSAERERAVPTARLTSRGESGPRVVPVTLEVNGRPLETRSVALGANGAATVEFPPITLASGGITRGVVRTPDDALPADNAFHFTLSPDQRIGVLIVGGSTESYFLERALAIGDSPGFRPSTRPEGGVRAADLTGAKVIVLNGVPLPAGEVGRRIRTFVESGGGLVVLPAEGRAGEWAGVLPRRLPAPVDHSSAGGVALGFMDFGHPALEVFSTPRSGDFTAARFFRYRPLEAAEGQRVLARFGDGGLALTEQRVGKGRVMIWTSTFDTRWGDLPLQPVFLPFVHQLVKHASGYAPPRPAFTVGDPFDPGTVAAASERYALALSPSGDRIELKDATPLPLDEPGFYQLRDARSGAQATAVAVNVDPAEANLEAVAPKEVLGVIAPKAGAGSSASEPFTLTLQEQEREQGAWWYLVVLGLVLLAVETVLSNLRRVSAGPRHPVPALSYRSWMFRRKGAIQGGP